MNSFLDLNVLPNHQPAAVVRVALLTPGLVASDLWMVEQAILPLRDLSTQPCHLLRNMALECQDLRELQTLCLP